MRFFSTVSLEKKIPLIVVGLALLACALMGIAAAAMGQKTQLQTAQHTLTMVNEARKTALEQYLAGLKADVQMLASNHQAISAIEEFAVGWEELGSEAQPYLQNLYIAANPRQAEARKQLDYASDQSFYSLVHRYHHPWFRQFAVQRGYADVFLFDLQGNAIYSMAKSLDYATNVHQGALKDTNLAYAFRYGQAATSAEDIAFFDMKPYPANGREASAFISAPIFRNSTKMGVVVIKIPSQALTQVVSQPPLIGNSYLIGEDLFSRSQPAGENADRVSVGDTQIDIAKKALAGDRGVAGQEIQGDTMFSAYSLVNFDGVKYAVITEQSRAAMLAPASLAWWNLLMIGGVVMIVITLASFAMGRTMTTPLRRVKEDIKTLAEGSQEVPLLEVSRGDEIGDIASSALILQEKLVYKKQMQDQTLMLNQAVHNHTSGPSQSEDFEETARQMAASIAELSKELKRVAELVKDGGAISAKDAEYAGQVAQATSSEFLDLLGNLNAAMQQLSVRVAQFDETLQQAANHSGQVYQGAATMQASSQNAKDLAESLLTLTNQINLAALNAVIEAGKTTGSKGASAPSISEIKNLARQSSVMARRISTAMKQWQADAQKLSQNSTSLKEMTSNLLGESKTIKSKTQQNTHLGTQLLALLKTPKAQQTSEKQESPARGAACHAEGNTSTTILDATSQMTKRAEALGNQAEGLLKQVRS